MVGGGDSQEGQHDPHNGQGRSVNVRGAWGLYEPFIIYIISLLTMRPGFPSSGIEEEKGCSFLFRGEGGGADLLWAYRPEGFRSAYATASLAISWRDGWPLGKPWRSHITASIAATGFFLSWSALWAAARTWRPTCMHTSEGVVNIMV